MTLPRVLTICHGHPRLVPGGTEIFAHDLHQALGEGGHAESFFVGCVTALHRANREESALQSFGGGANEFLLHVGRFDPLMLSHAGEGASIAAMGKLLATVQPDIVHFHHLLHVGTECLALVKRVLPKARIVFTLHDFHPICARDGLMVKAAGDTLCHEAGPDACHGCFPNIAAARFALRRLHMGNMLGLVDRFVSPALFLRDRFVTWGLSADRISHIPNGVPELVPAAAGADHAPAARFGYFGTIAPHKGVLLALEAIANMDEAIGASLHLFGDPSNQAPEFKAEFERALRRSRSRAVHRGAYDRTDLARLMGGIDWVVVPSLWWENAPLVILEAFRQQRPVIAADVGGMAELVRHEGNGLLFRHGNAVDLSRTMTRAATEEGLWNSIRAAIAPVPTVTAAAAAHARLYRELIDSEQRMSA